MPIGKQLKDQDASKQQLLSLSCSCLCMCFVLSCIFFYFIYFTPSFACLYSVLFWHICAVTYARVNCSCMRFYLNDSFSLPSLCLITLLQQSCMLKAD